MTHKDLLSILSAFVPDELLEKALEEVLKAFPIGTVHNWNNGPHKKTAPREWVPLEGTELEAYYQANPDERPAHGAGAKIHSKIKEKGKKHLEETGEGRPEKPRHFKAARVISKAVFRAVLDLGHFSIISAGRNGTREEGEDPKDPYYQDRRDALREDLDELGVPFIEVSGKYGTEEDSFVVIHEPLPPLDGREQSFMVGHGRNKEEQDRLVAYLDRLAKKYNQDSLVHAMDSEKVIMRFTTQHPDRQRPRQDLVADVVDGKLWKDMTAESDFYTDVPHPADVHTKFAYNFDVPKMDAPEHSYAG